MMKRKRSLSAEAIDAKSFLRHFNDHRLKSSIFLLRRFIDRCREASVVSPDTRLPTLVI
jgi:hypothetical protein